jgi:hypothetical protein
MRHCRFAGYPGDQIKAAGQEGIVESAWVPIVPLWGTPRGGCDESHVRPGLRPVDGSRPAPCALVESDVGRDPILIDEYEATNHDSSPVTK